MIYLGQFKGFKALEPLILDHSNPDSLIERLPNNIENDIGYIELLYIMNIFLFYLLKYEYLKEKNILFNISRYHSEGDILDNNIFLREI